MTRTPVWERLSRWTARGLGMLAALSPGWAWAEPGEIDPSALDGVFGSSMGTALALVGLTVVLAAAAVGLVTVALRLTGRVEGWDERKRQRPRDAPAWTDEERRRFLATR